MPVPASATSVPSPSIATAMRRASSTCASRGWYSGLELGSAPPAPKAATVASCNGVTTSPRRRTSADPIPALCGHVRRELHLQQHDGVLDLQLALLQAAHRELVAVRVANELLDHLVKPPMLELQLCDAQLEGIDVLVDG